MSKRALAAFFLAFLGVLPAAATTVKPLFLDEIIDGAAVAFQGVCVDNRTQRDERNGLIVTYTTFEVSDVLKGQVGPTYTIKQIGGTLAGEGLQFRVDGVPAFTRGQGYVVFIAGVSAAGFSSPVGLAQGRFSIVASATGPAVTNGRDFNDLTSRMAPQALPKSVRTDRPVKQLGLDEFKSLVRQYAGTAQ